MFEITINGQVVKCFFGLHVFEELAKYTQEGGDLSHFGFLSVLVESAHQNYCKSERPALQPVVNYGEVRRYLEGNAADNDVANELVKLLEVYNQSTPKKMIDKINETAAEPVKKKIAKPTGKK